MEHMYVLLGSNIENLKAAKMLIVFLIILIAAFEKNENLKKNYPKYNKTSNSIVDVTVHICHRITLKFYFKCNNSIMFIAYVNYSGINHTSETKMINSVLCCC